ncbi:hypothetical protein EON77_02250 [bacterium]|nr:MAG: hypothetical protein EON77_02250 [bacterium]
MRNSSASFRLRAAPFVAVLAFGALGLACSGAAEDDADDADDADETTAELVSPNGAQRFDMNAGISVCFESHGGRYDLLNNAFREGVTAQWGARVGVKFTYFSNCEERGADVRIAYFSGGGAPYAEGVGKRSPSVVHMRTDYEGHWMAGNCRGDGPLAECTRAYAIHEFGHVLGFGHEMGHPGSTCVDKEDAVQGWVCGGYDPNSIMNYCATIAGNGIADRRQWAWKGLSGQDVDCARRYLFAAQERAVCLSPCCAGDTACERDNAPVCYGPGDHAWVGAENNDRYARVELRGGATFTGYTDSNFQGSSYFWNYSEGCMGQPLLRQISSLRVY